MNGLTVRGLSLFFALCLLSACRMHTVDGSPFSQNARKTASEINMRLGLAYLKAGDSVRAKHKLLLALEHDPFSAIAHSAMGYFLEKTGALAEAKLHYQKSLQYAPKQGELLNNYGAYLCRLKQYRHAEKYFLAAIRDSHYIHAGEAYENAGLCLLQIPDIQKATAYFESAIRQDPQRVVAHEELLKLKRRV